MDREALRIFLEKIRDGGITIEEGIAGLKDLYYTDLGCAKLDNHRELRVGYPEVIYCPGKTADQVKTVVRAMRERNSNILATKADEDVFMAVRGICPDAVYHLSLIHI